MMHIFCSHNESAIHPRQERVSNTSSIDWHSAWAPKIASSRTTTSLCSVAAATAVWLHKVYRTSRVPNLSWTIHSASMSMSMHSSRNGGAVTIVC